MVINVIFLITVIRIFKILIRKEKIMRDHKKE
jgi:hypothetical protein